MADHRLNRFRGARIVRVSALPATLFLAILINGTLFLFAAGFFYLTWQHYSVKPVIAAEKQYRPVISFLPSPSSTVAPSPTPMPTVTPFPTWTPMPTVTPFPTWTPMATVTPFPTWTPIPTWTPEPSPTPFPSPTRVLYSLEYLESSPSAARDLASVESSFPFGFYRALCHDVPGQRFIQPRVVSSVDLSQEGYSWLLDNALSGYDYVDRLPHTSDITFYLSESASIFSIQLYWHDDPISDRVAIDFPESCRSAQLIFVESKPRAFDVEIGGIAVSGSTGQQIAVEVVQ